MYKFENEKIIRDRIRQFIDAKCIKQADLADVTKISRSVISEMLNGKRSIKNLQKKLQELYELEDDYFSKGLNENGESANDLRRHFISYANAGLLTAEEGTDYEMQPVIKQMPKYDYTVDVKGDSMFPEIKSGDIIACLNVTNEPFLQWGRTHILNTSQGVVVKKIHPDGDCIKCVSLNQEEFPPFSIPKDRIYSIGLVVGVLRF